MMLSDFKVDDIRINTKTPEKIKAYCKVKDKEDAKVLYKEFTWGVKPPLKAVIFLDFPEAIFVKHGDAAADKYYKQVEEEKERRR